jgi:hypothetical protein
MFNITHLRANDMLIGNVIHRAAVTARMLHFCGKLTLVELIHRANTLLSKKNKKYIEPIVTAANHRALFVETLMFMLWLPARCPGLPSLASAHFTTAIVGEPHAMCDLFMLGVHGGGLT